MAFPITRLRRLRSSDTLRRMVRENHLRIDDLIWPVFVTHGKGVKKAVSAMPGVYNYSVDILLDELKELIALGIPGIILFGIPANKDAVGSEGYADDGIIQKAVRAVKDAYPALLVVTDVCLCEYTDHGHCGIVKEGKVINDATLELLQRCAISHVHSGADMVAPSDMMDGRIAAIRSALDGEGYSDIPIMAYSAKFASAFYGPFREAAGSAPQFGDRKSYQMDSPNAREALREMESDMEEGADIVMVKPALAYMDIIRKAKDTFNLPMAAYNVSGEYSMVKAAASQGWIDEKGVVLEYLTGLKRAGTDIILTYHALDVARWLQYSD